ncbi:MAG: TPM domain-containing protein [Pseudanabaenaceae cyanobacterium bins.39]|nr:TPM domain-containing protein [Pseudanabaenaceae cyanobacterium bins.39]
MKGNFYRFLELLTLVCVLSIALVSTAIFIAPKPAIAIPINEIPNPRRANGGWISDVAKVLSDEGAAKINTRINRLEARNGSEIAVVTVPDLLPLKNSKAYATELFNTWGIGKRAVNNGVLILLAVQERRIEVETGRGIVPYLSDRLIQKTIDEQIIPELKLRNFDQALINGVVSIADRLEEINFTAFQWGFFERWLVLAALLIIGISTIWSRYKFRKWCQLLPSVKSPSPSSLLFEITIPKLSEIMGLPLVGMVLGWVGIAICFSNLLLATLPNNFVMTSFQKFGVTFGASSAIAGVSIFLWVAIVYVWLSDLRQVMQVQEQPELWQGFVYTFQQHWGALWITQLAIAIVSFIVIPLLELVIPSQVIFSLEGLAISLGYQILFIGIINEIRINTKLKLQPSTYFCSTCRLPMSLLNDSSDRVIEAEIFNQYLTKPELCAVELGNATYKLYTCDRCYPVPDRQNIYCQLHILKSESLCQECNYPTVTRVGLKKSRQGKTFPKQGKQKAIGIWQCQNCCAEKPIYPQAPKVASTSSSYSSNDYSSSSYSSTDSYDYGSSSSDFGGGSSDGGGAGGDW